MDAVTLLFDAFRPGELPHLPLPAPPGTRCALTGRALAAGYPAKDILTSASADIADTFRSPGTWVCEEAARLFKESRLLTSNLLALPARGLRPMVAQASATPERPAWRDLLRALAPGTPTVAIFTSNTKRRLWPAARLSYFGPTWQPLFCDGTEERTLRLDAARLLACLTLVEEVYEAGFNKEAMRVGLLDQSAAKAIRALGWGTARAYEHRLAPWRGSDEFLLSLFVAQKSDEGKDSA
jgi:hypothetical protein